MLLAQLPGRLRILVGIAAGGHDIGHLITELGVDLRQHGGTAQQDRLVLTGKLVSLLGSRGNNWEILTAGAFITIVVPLIVFFALQRYFVRGLLAGSVK